MKNLNKNLIWAFMLALIVTFTPEISLAGDPAVGFNDVLCKIFDCFLGSGVVSVIATVAIIFLGIGAFFGKVNWGLVIVTAIGVVVVVGAFEIVQLLDSDAVACTATC